MIMKSYDRKTFIVVYATNYRSAFHFLQMIFFVDTRRWSKSEEPIDSSPTTASFCASFSWFQSTKIRLSIRKRWISDRNITCSRSEQTPSAHHHHPKTFHPTTRWTRLQVPRTMTSIGSTWKSFSTRSTRALHRPRKWCANNSKTATTSRQVIAMIRSIAPATALLTTITTWRTHPDQRHISSISLWIISQRDTVSAAWATTHHRSSSRRRDVTCAIPFNVWRSSRTRSSSCSR